MVNECDGCVLLSYYRGGDCFCNKIDECPCKACLVKVMCKEACGDLQIHFRLAKKLLLK